MALARSPAPGFSLFLVLAFTAVDVAPAPAQSREAGGETGVERDWILETGLTFGRAPSNGSEDPLWAQYLAFADLGVRWTYASGLTVGASLAVGHDPPMQAALIGLRGRGGYTWGTQRVEGSVGVFFTTMVEAVGGVIVGLAYYPVPWAGLVGQLDMLPTTAVYTSENPQPVIDGYGLPPQVDYGPYWSAGIRLVDEAAVASWITVGALALLSLAASS